MKRNELVKLATAKGIKKASSTKSEVLIEELKKLKVIKGKKTGRKIDPTSARQKRLAELEAKRKNGELKRGRPVDSSSARQQRLKELEAKRKAGELVKGRPVDPNSARQQRLAELEAKRKAGLLKRGRPSKAQVVEDAINNDKVVLN